MVSVVEQDVLGVEGVVPDLGPVKLEDGIHEEPEDVGDFRE